MEVYLPKHMIPDGDMDVEDFFRLIAKAQYVRDLRIADIRAGIIEAFNEIYED